MVQKLHKPKGREKKCVLDNKKQGREIGKMKKLFKSTVVAASIVGFSVTGAWATPALYDWSFNIDGTVSKIGSATGVDVSGFDDLTGLGTITYTTSTFGGNSFLAFFDHEIDETINTYFNEIGSASGTVAEGQSWEIDEPDWVFGDIYDNFENNTLDNDIFNGNTSLADDVSMAMGWDFMLAADETAVITLTLSEILPLSGFYLTHWDPHSDSGLYCSSSLDITGGGGPAPVPEPATMLLFGTGLAGLYSAGRKKSRKLNK